MRRPDDEFIHLIDDGEPAPSLTAPSACWKVLVVDDDHEVHAATRFALENAVILGRPLKLFSSLSAAEAKGVLKANPDVAVLLLDVVMEEHDSGLRLVQWIRSEGFVSQRIILRTGQPGYAPEIDVIKTYDINDYRSKSELTHTRLVTAMTSAIRSYQQIEAIERNRRGLEAMVASCNRLLGERDIARFCEGVLTELSAILQTPREGLICQGRVGGANEEMRVVMGVGRWARTVGAQVGDFPDDAFLNTVRSYGAPGAPIGRTINAPRLPWVMFSVEARPDRRYLICLDHDEPLSAVDSALLRVFAANIAAGFENVELIESLAARTVDLERFAFAAAHDLQEPLRKIAMLADVVGVQASELNDASREHLKTMNASAAHMRKLVGRLLEYVTSSRDDLEMSDLPLGEVVVDVEDTLREALSAAGAVLDVAPLPWVRGDAGSLARVLTLLIENAIAYRGAEPLRISLTAQEDGEDVVLAVADNGRGFDPDRSENIFEAFRRLHRQAEAPGTGLGLSIAKRLVEHHSGRLWAESAPGLGSTFFVKLPRARLVDATDMRADDRRLLEAMSELMAIASGERLAS